MSELACSSARYKARKAAMVLLPTWREVTTMTRAAAQRSISACLGSAMKLSACLAQATGSADRHTSGVLAAADGLLECTRGYDLWISDVFGMS